MSIADRGFAHMDKDKQREIASKGGRTRVAMGVGHFWTSEEAKAFASKGGKISKRPKRQS